MRVGELAERVSRHDPEVVHHHGFVLVDSDGKLAGVITRKDIYRALNSDPLGETTVFEAGTKTP